MTWRVAPFDRAIAEAEAYIGAAREWLAKPLDVSELQLTNQRYAAVDTLDDARDVIASDPAVAAILLADCVRMIIAYAFWRARRFQPRRKAAVAALATFDS